jgi:DNA polymerase III subunit gamma/tau
MTYQVLARKWRPQEFAELIGQEPIVTALRNGLAEGRIAQAYVFSGIRGVGKTTAARLLAKALNCERGAANGPCNACASCRDITIGSAMDVLEVDAATYSKVEQVRDLTESLRYGPARDRYKVVILDEVHRLSRQAFDALLKVVEEPPAWLVFIFATTEIEAVPATILSRCQEYHFRRVAVPVVAAHLREIATAEKIDASDAALRLLARAGEGSVRDSVALLDQLATFGAGTVAEEDAARLLGGLDTAMFATLFAALLAGRSGEVVAAVRRVEDEGWDPRHVYAHFLAYVRHGLHLALAGDSAEMALVDLPAEEAKELAERARAAGYENVLRLLHLLLASETTVRRSELAALAVEIAWLRAAELPKLVRIEELLAAGAATVTPKSSPVRAAATTPPAPPQVAATVRAPVAPTLPTVATPAMPKVPSPGGNSAAVHAPPPASPDQPPAPPTTTATTPASVAAFQEALAKRRQPLAAYLGSALELTLSGEQIHITLAAGDHSLAEALARGANAQTFDEVLRDVLGPGASYQLHYRSLPSAATAAAAAPETPRTTVHNHPTVQAVLEIFGGTVQHIELPPAEDEE